MTDENTTGQEGFETLLRRVGELALEEVRPLAEERDLRLWSRFESDLPRIEGDSGRLTQVLVNLLSNAVKYTPSGGRVFLSAARGELRCSPLHARRALRPELTPAEAVGRKFFRRGTCLSP